MIIKNYQIETLHAILFSPTAKASASDSRLRTRFTRLIESHYNGYVEEMNTLLKYYQSPDEEGNMHIPEQFKEELATEMTNLSKEYLELEDTDYNKTMYHAVYRILTSDKLEVNSQDAYIHDEICTQFEEILN